MIEELQYLPIVERLRLVEDLWDSIAAEQDSLSLTEAQKAELDRRIDVYERDGIKGRVASDVISDIR